MSTAGEKLENISNQLKNGVAPPREYVRSFLRWFGAERRGYRIVQYIRRVLKEYGIVTTPDFEYAYIDASIGFQRASEVTDSARSRISTRIGRLESANKAPVSVKPDSTVQQAITLMMTNDFSQLPVMTSIHDVKGIVSWKSIGSRLALKRACSFVREYMEPAHIVSIEDSLFSAIQCNSRARLCTSAGD